MKTVRLIFGLLCMLALQSTSGATDYYVHPVFGKDKHAGQSKQQAFRTLARASQISLLPGDRLLLAAGHTHRGSLRLIGQHGSAAQPIVITAVAWDEGEALAPALIDFKGELNGILLQGASFVQVSNLRLTGNGYEGDAALPGDMRCGVLIANHESHPVSDITLSGLHIADVFFEQPGFTRGEKEVRTANGTQRYGWGIRVINRDAKSVMHTLRIEDCVVENVSHTGIKFTGKAQNIRQFLVSGNRIEKVGGPGIQMSEVRDVHVRGNTVRYSGSKDDTRKWGRGSGLWTWGSSRVLIEHNAFLHANGPGDSAGAHIDFNCDNIILQYNLSAYNAGGFCEVLGNTYNCAYRYNLSINDGWRVKGVDGAFQEGKILWLSGYQGNDRERKGPVNFYFHNNTIYCDASLPAKIAIDPTSKGILIANNIFHLRGGAKMVLGDQYKPDTENGGTQLEQVLFEHNLFLDAAAWPSGMSIKDTAPLFGDPGFKNEGGDKPEDYMPERTSLVKHRGAAISLLPGDSIGLWQPLHLERDLLGRPAGELPSIGAVEPVE